MPFVCRIRMIWPAISLCGTIKNGLLSLKGEGHLDLKAFQKSQGLRRLSLASPADLAAFLQLAPGSVTPFGLLNDARHRVEFFLDRRFLEGAGRIGIHPNENTATVWLAARDLLRLLEEQGPLSM